MKLKTLGVAALLALSLVSAPRAVSAASLGDIVDVLDDILDSAEGILEAAEEIVESGAFADLLPLTDEIQQVRDILDKAQDVSFDLETVIDEFAEVFPESFEELDLAQTVQSINTVNAAGREAIERALEIQSETVESQLPSTIRVQAIRAAGTFGGPLVALQSLVQLQSEQFSQFNRLQTLIASQSRLLGIESAERETARKRGKRLRELDDPTVFATDEPVDILFGSELN